MARIPTNVSLFGQYLMGKKETITEKDFTPKELQSMVKQIEDQDAINVASQKRLNQQEARLKTRSETGKDGISYVKGVGKKLTISDMTGELENAYSSQEKYNTEVQDRLNKIQLKLGSYEKTKDRTSVSYREERKDSMGLGLIDAISKTFNSSAYNIETSLGHYTAFKNSDGTVTVKDKYDFLNYGFKKGQTVNLKDFIKAIPLAFSKPEAFGSALARFAFPDRSRDVKIKLPKKDSLLSEGKSKAKSKPSKNSLLDLKR
jgi:hypothetical protein